MKKNADIIITSVLLLIPSFIMSVFTALWWAFPVKWLWNYTVPTVFHGVGTLDFWHAWTLGVLCRLLWPKAKSNNDSDNEVPATDSKPKSDTKSNKPAIKVTF